MKRLICLSGILFLVLNAWSSTASANPYGVYYSTYTSYGTITGATAQQVANELGQARCGPDPLESAELSDSYPLPPPGQTATVAKFDIYCDWGYKKYVQNMSVTYSTPAACPTGQEWNVATQQCETPQPECTSPNYIDVVSGECVPPEEVCFTTIETMATECVYIGEDDPADDVPNGCIAHAETGAEICLSEEPGCYLADGKTICPTPDLVCGTKNGTFSCVSPEEEGCGYYNGERVCFTTDGEKVENTSPDHPDNGGNLDGDETNDMLDSRDPSEGGDPNNQIDSPIAPTQAGEEATEKTARDQLKELKKINESLNKMGKGGELKGNEASSKIDEAVPGLIGKTGIDGLTNGMNTNPFAAGDLGTLPGIAEGLIPQGSCIAYSQDVLGFGTFEITCDDTLLLRTILEWLFYVITAIYLFQLATTPVRS